MELVPFTADQIDQAGELVALRHRRLRLTASGLPSAFAEPPAAVRAVAAAWARPQTSGVAALRSGQLVGFLVGTLAETPLRGRHGWVHLAGHALAETEPADLYADLYTHLAAGWVERGCFHHFAMIPAADHAALDAWFGLSFGKEQAHALMPIEPPAAGAAGLLEGGLPEGGLPDGVAVRLAGPDDLERMLAVADLIARHQVESPVFGITLPEQGSDWREGWTEFLADPGARIWIAEQAGQVISFAAFSDLTPGDTDLLTPADAVELNVAATRPEARGLGLGKMLVAKGLMEAWTRGRHWCLTDWRTTNLLSSRLWPRLGFQPQVYRLQRRVDERISWARGPLSG